MENARDLSARLVVLLRCEQGAMADFLIALAAFDRDRHWVGLGYTSLFYYLHRELKLSAGAAFHRKTAAELIQRFPEVLDPLRDGRLCLSSVCELAKVMKPENRAEVLPRFFHASKREAKAVAAEIAPLDVIPQRVVVTPVAARTLPSLPEREAAAPAALELGQAFHPGETPPAASRAGAPLLAPAATPRSAAEPLTADLRRLHVTVSKRFMDKLEATRDALSHSHPGADVETILEVGLDLLLERAAKRKGLVKRPRTNDATAAHVDDEDGQKARRIPAAVQREVWMRDGGRCQWPMADGGVCGSTCRLQFDHIVPVARGGRSVSGNLRLACTFHNDLAARKVYGDEFMSRFTRSKGVVSPQPAPPR